VRIPILLSILSLLLVSPAAADPKRDKRWQALAKGAASIKTLKATFKQRKSLKILKRPLVSRGSFYFKAPSSVRWEYRSPIRTLSLVHQGKVRRYTWSSAGKPVKDSAGSVEAMRTVLEQISGWLAGRFDADGVFAARLGPGEPLVVILEPNKKELSRFIKRVELRFSDRPGVVKSVLIVESARASTELSFEDVKVNGELPARLFTKVDP
jgi:outer membrane lipoprotein carrier protein